MLEHLSERLIERYGNGYSVPNLKNFRQFFLTFSDRAPQIGYPVGSELKASEKRHPSGSQSEILSLKGFHPNLMWSHYRALMRVENKNARDFYEVEAARCNWAKRDLERQIATLFYERTLASRNKAGMLQDAAKLSMHT